MFARPLNKKKPLAVKSLWFDCSVSKRDTERLERDGRMDAAAAAAAWTKIAKPRNQKKWKPKQNTKNQKHPLYFNNTIRRRERRRFLLLESRLWRLHATCSSSLSLSASLFSERVIALPPLMLLLLLLLLLSAWLSIFLFAGWWIDVADGDH